MAHVFISHFFTMSELEAEQDLKYGELELIDYAQPRYYRIASNMTTKWVGQLKLGVQEHMDIQSQTINPDWKFEQVSAEEWKYSLDLGDDGGVILSICKVELDD